MKVLGWSRGKNRQGDETGIFHLIVADDSPHLPRATQACGSKGLVSGQVESPPDPRQKCGRCTILESRLNGKAG